MGGQMSNNVANRSSEPRIAAWHAPALTEESATEAAAALEASPATVLVDHVIGGANPTGITLSLAYDGDDVPLCENDILFLLRWYASHTPLPEIVREELDFEHVGPPAIADGSPSQSALGD
jgi:hypothetical protein